MAETIDKLRIAERRVALGQLFARRGQEGALAEKLRLPLAPGCSAVCEEYVALPLAPGQWMLLAENDEAGFCRRMAERIGDLGHISEQSDSRVAFRVSGGKAREMLAKGCALDTHPRVMKPWACAVTIMADVGVLLHQVDDAPSYDLLVYAGYAACFREWLEEAAAEFGFDFESAAS